LFILLLEKNNQSRENVLAPHPCCSISTTVFAFGIEKIIRVGQKKEKDRRKSGEASMRALCHPLFGAAVMA
jgi:hypothetical protein